MKLAWFRRNAALIFGLLISTCVVWTAFSVQYFRTHWTSEDAKELEQKADLWAKRIESDWSGLIQRAQWLVEAARQNFTSQESQLLFLKKNLAHDPRLLAVTVYRKHLGVSQHKSQELRATAEWRPNLYLTRSKDDPDRLGSKEIEELDIRAPIDFEAVAARGADLRRTDNNLRIAVPQSPDEAIVLEIHAARWMDTLQDRSGTRALLLSPRGSLLWNSPAMKEQALFQIGEDLRHLPIWEAARGAEESGIKTGAMTYRPLPNLPNVRANFRAIEPGSALVITHSEPVESARAWQAEYLRVCLYLSLGLIAIFGGIAVILNLSWNQHDMRAEAPANPEEADADSDHEPRSKAA